VEKQRKNITFPLLLHSLMQENRYQIKKSGGGSELDTSCIERTKPNLNQLGSGVKSFLNLLLIKLVVCKFGPPFEMRSRIILDHRI
jgi:hypothetical protein